MSNTCPISKSLQRFATLITALEIIAVAVGDELEGFLHGLNLKLILDQNIIKLKNLNMQTIPAKQLEGLNILKALSNT